MAYHNLYCAGQDINLTAPQRATLWQVIQGIATIDGQPANHNHKRLSTDGSLIVFQGMFDDADLSVAAFTQRLAAAFGVNPSSIDVTPNSQEWGGYTCPFWTFARLGTNYFRLGIFAGANATVEQSRTACTAWFLANIAAFE